MKEIDALRSELLTHGARFSVVKNTLTRRAAEEAGADALLAMLEGPTAIAFLESDGDAVAVAKALGEAARTTRVLEVRGGLLEGRPMSADEVQSLAKVPPADVLRGQVLGAVTAPLTAIIGLFTAPLQDLYGLIDARIDQLGGAAPAAPGADEPEAAAAPAEPQPEEPAPAEAAAEAPEPEAAAPDEAVAETTDEAPEEEE
jgi:large subunit ribosomal protein L10